MSNLTIKQIANCIGCTKIKVYKYIRANNIQETLQNGNTLFYSEQIANQIISNLKETESVPKTFNNVSKSFQNVSENSFKTAFETLTEQIRIKDEQLLAKDKQIEQLTSALQLAQETQQQLTESLTASQALHAGTIQQQLTDNQNKPRHWWQRKKK